MRKKNVCNSNRTQNIKTNVCFSKPSATNYSLCFYLNYFIRLFKFILENKN